MKMVKTMIKLVETR